MPIQNPIPNFGHDIVYENINQKGEGTFVDMCEGPHLNSTTKLKAFKLTRIAGAYWKGDEKNPMLQRIYGVCFENQKDLDEYLKKMEEAKKREIYVPYNLEDLAEDIEGL